jgi:hypothetical protein
MTRTRTLWQLSNLSHPRILLLLQCCNDLSIKSFDTRLCWSRHVLKPSRFFPKLTSAEAVTVWLRLWFKFASALAAHWHIKKRLHHRCFGSNFVQLFSTILQIVSTFASRTPAIYSLWDSEFVLSVFAMKLTWCVNVLTGLDAIVNEGWINVCLLLSSWFLRYDKDKR